jgi:hypothetical protein
VQRLEEEIKTLETKVKSYTDFQAALGGGQGGQ